MNLQNFRVEELKEFLVEAKKSTYAGDGQIIAPSRLGSKDLPYKKGDYYYLDSYLGSINFIGEEAVWYRDTPIWGMNYYGEMLVENIPDGFSKCLKGALLMLPLDSPFRGPHVYQSNEYRYECVWKGDMSSFCGEEFIYLEDNLIYELKFHGGYIK
ncbi:MAG TPA: DUF5680 domain-containing protein [Clostridia bacterium]|nr:DUF5680 domain-containing protein [Clostridia bacterium]